MVKGKEKMVEEAALGLVKGQVLRKGFFPLQFQLAQHFPYILTLWIPLYGH